MERLTLACEHAQAHHQAMRELVWAARQTPHSALEEGIADIHGPPAEPECTPTVARLRLAEERTRVYAVSLAGDCIIAWRLTPPPSMQIVAYQLRECECLGMGPEYAGDEASS